MRIRTRNGIKVGLKAGNLVLVRSVYDPKLKRCRELYLGTVAGATTPTAIPSAIKVATDSTGAPHALTEPEIAQLRAYLKSNEADPIAAARALPGLLQNAARAIVERARARKAEGIDRDPELYKLVLAIRNAYEPGKNKNGFYEQMRRVKLVTTRPRGKKAAQDRPAATQPTETAGGVPTD